MAYRHVVRIVLTQGQYKRMSSLLEVLESSGGIMWHRKTGTGSPKCFDIPAPDGLLDEDTRDWAENYAAMISEQGFNAVEAPEWL